MGFRRRPSSTLALGRGEKVLAVAQLTEEVEVVATSLRLVVRSSDGAAWERCWPEIDTVTWDSEERLLTVVDIEGGGTGLDLVADAHLRLAQVVRERVQSTLVASRRVQVPGGQVRLVVRKDGGHLVVQELADPGADATGARARAQVAQAKRELADLVGLSREPDVLPPMSAPRTGVQDHP